MGIINAFVAQQREADRQSRIKQGMSRIDGAFQGFDDNYYRDYATAQNEYNMPQMDKQYLDAEKELTFRHARAGTLNSSMSATNIADLAKQNATNRAAVLAQGDRAAADLRSNVAANKAAITNQLYSTSDPDLASNAALTASKNLGADQPSLSPLSALFQLPIVGAGNYMQGYNTASAYKNAGFGTNGGGLFGGGASQNTSRNIG